MPFKKISSRDVMIYLGFVLDRSIRRRLNRIIRYVTCCKNIMYSFSTINASGERQLLVPISLSSMLFDKRMNLYSLSFDCKNNLFLTLQIDKNIWDNLPKLSINNLYIESDNSVYHGFFLLENNVGNSVLNDI